ncbi:MAG TPA: hypothetical protein VFN40_02490 [Gemmatimonadales bacterium]|nr:hypothetical protein [Gemmatimonadales bacterium]
MNDHSTLREGAVTGAIGALIVAVWYLIVDTAGGQPFHTPNVLGKIFFRGDLTPGVRRIVPHVVLGYTAVHFLTFVLMGMGLTLLVHLASRNISLRMGVWLGLVVAFALFAGLTYMLGAATGERLSPWSVISGSLLGVLGMGGYLWRRHPRLVRSFDEAPLGAEGKAPPHPPRAA